MENAAQCKLLVFHNLENHTIWNSVTSLWESAKIWKDYMCLLLMNLPHINNDNWTEWSQFWSEIVLMISNRTPTPCSFYLKIMHVICVGSHDLQVHFGINQLKQIFQRLTKLHEPSRVSAISSLWKTLEFWFIPNFTSKIMWLLVNNIQAKIFLFFSL